jgi:outer membrane translocation and assembly module TamA
MRRRGLFSAVLAAAVGSLLSLCVTQAQAQKFPKRCLPQAAATQPPKVFIDQLIFDNTSFPDGLTESQLVASLKARALNAGSDWHSQITREVREAWQNAGYFQAVATVKAHATGASADGRHVALTVHVDPGPRYRLRRIRIRTTDPGGKLVFSEEELRKLIPVRYGEILDAGKIREGLKAIQDYYGARGYIDMTATPGFHIHPKTDDVSFYVFIDQRKQYRVGQLTILGLNSSMESMLRSKIAPGDIFNWNRVLDFYQSQQPVLPPRASPKDDQVYRVPNSDKVDVWLDFRACPQPGQSNPGASTGLD